MGIADYGNSIIYKLCCKDIEITDEYVGSTMYFNQRKRKHRNACNSPNTRKYNQKVYKFIRGNGGWSNWSMIQIEEYDAKDKRDLHKRERYWIETLISTLNCNIPTRSKKEYSDDNKDTQTQYRQDNKEKIKQYYQDNKERIQQYYQDNKGKKAQYYRDNKEKIKKQDKKKYQDNKERLLEKFNCECGGKYIHQNKSTHLKTKKHQTFISINELCIKD